MVTYAVLLNWNNWETTSKCIISLIESKEKSLEIIVVDNASDDESIQQLKARFPQITYLINHENLGFASGCNVGIKHAIKHGAAFVLLINNDVTVRPGFLSAAIEHLNKNENVFAVTGKILMSDPSEHIWQAGGHIDMFRIQGVARGFGEKDVNQYNENCETKWASGAFSLFPIRTFRMLDLLPEEYFFGQEEWDYSRKIIANGKLIKYIPSFTCVHASGDSYKRNHPILLVYGCYLNKNIFAKKYLGGVRYLIWRFLFHIYVRMIWPFKAKSYVTEIYSLDDYRRAAIAATRDFDRVKKVTRQTLIDASEDLQIPSSWRS